MKKVFLAGPVLSRANWGAMALERWQVLLEGFGLDVINPSVVVMEMLAMNLSERLILDQLLKHVLEADVVVSFPHWDRDDRDVVDELALARLAEKRVVLCDMYLRELERDGKTVFSKVG